MNRTKRIQNAFYAARLIRIYEIANMAIGDEAAATWLNTPNSALGFSTPAKHLTTPMNVAEVVELIAAEATVYA